MDVVGQQYCVSSSYFLLGLLLDFPVLDWRSSECLRLKVPIIEVQISDAILVLVLPAAEIANCFSEFGLAFEVGLVLVFLRGDLFAVPRLDFLFVVGLSGKGGTGRKNFFCGLTMLAMLRLMDCAIQSSRFSSVIIS